MRGAPSGAGVPADTVLALWPRVPGFVASGWRPASSSGGGGPDMIQTDNSYSVDCVAGAGHRGTGGLKRGEGNV